MMLAMMTPTDRSRGRGKPTPVLLAPDSFKGTFSAPEVRIESELYEASAAGLLGRLQRVGDAVPSVMLIGHNPSMERLALDLANGGPELAELADKYPTGALATLEFDGAWSELEADAARLVGFVKPRNLE